MKKNAAKKTSNARKISALETRNWTYGAGPSSDVPFIRQQCFEQHQLKNKRKEIEKTKRTQRKGILLKLSPELTVQSEQINKIQAEIDVLREKLQNFRDPEKPGRGVSKHARDRYPETIAIQEEIDVLSKARKAAWQVYAKVQEKVVEEVLLQGQNDYTRRKALAELRYAVGKKGSEKLNATQRETLNKCEAFLHAWQTKHAANDGSHVESEEQETSDLKAQSLLIARCGLVGPTTRGELNAQVWAEMQADPTVSEVWKEINHVDQEAKHNEKLVRGASACFSGVKAAVDQALTASFKHPTFPFNPFMGQGTIAIQIQGGMTVDELFNPTSRVPQAWLVLSKEHARKSRGASRLVFGMPEATPEEIVQEAHRQGFNKRFTVKTVEEIRRHAKPENAALPPRRMATLHLNLGKDPLTKETKVVQIPVNYDRPLPADGRIMWIYYDVKRIGTRQLYQVRFVTEAASFADKDVPEEGLLAVDFGWRASDQGIQVAKTFDGKEFRTHVIPERMMSLRTHCRSLLSFADQHFEDARNFVASWLKANPDWSWVSDEHLRERLSHIMKWRSHGRMARVVSAMLRAFAPNIALGPLWKKWREERHALRVKYNDDTTNDLFDSYAVLSAWFQKQGITNESTLAALYMEWWRRKDEHLVNWSRFEERGAQNRRKDIYRKWAFNWASGYAQVAFEKQDKAEIARIPKPEKNRKTKQQEDSNSLRHFVGVSVLTDALKYKFRGRFKEVSKIPTDHFGCGGEGQYNPKNLLSQCDKCHKMFDPTENNLRHLWDHLHGEHPGGVENPVPARDEDLAEEEVAAE